MSLNKLALIRYKTIDACLSNRGRKWTLEDLIDKVSEALYEYEGIRKGVSKRTIQLDIQTMRSEKLGYHAPIVVLDKKYYTYEDPKYSITQSGLKQPDLDNMREVVGILKQLNGLRHFGEMSDLIARLEHKLYAQQRAPRSCIQFEGNPLLLGLDFLDPTYQAILHKRSLLIDYQSFKARQVKTGIYYPYLLKEFRNRWFLIARPKNRSTLVTLALDRIASVQELPSEVFVDYQDINFDTYYSDVIGVTKTEKDQPMRIVLQFDREIAPYVRTKPLHQSQVIEKSDETGIILRIDVVLNLELEREILGFGEQVKVLSPRILAHRIQQRLGRAYNAYLTLENKPKL